MQPLLIVALMSASDIAPQPGRTAPVRSGRTVVRIVQPARATASDWERGHPLGRRTLRVRVEPDGTRRQFRLLEFE